MNINIIYAWFMTKTYNYVDKSVYAHESCGYLLTFIFDFIEAKNLDQC